MQSMGRSMDTTLKDNMVDALFFCATLTGHRGGHTPFVQTGAETSDTGVEAVKPDPGFSWEGHSGVVGALCREWKCGGVRGCPPTLHSIGDPPTASHVCCCCQKNWWGCVRRVQIGVSIWGAAFAIDGRVSAEWSRSPDSVARRARDSVAPLRRSSAGGCLRGFWRLSAMRRVWALRHQIGTQYSAVECTRAKVAIRRVVAPAHQREARTRHRCATRDVKILGSDSRCRRYVSDLSNVTPRYLL